MKEVFKYLILGIIYGFIYNFIEVIYRGYTHWTMWVLAFIVGILIGAINNVISWNISLFKQLILGVIIATSLEFLFGCIINIELGWNVWDYSNVPFNIMGQVCLPFSFIWGILCLILIIFDDYIRYYFFNEKKPKYKLF